MKTSSPNIFDYTDPHQFLKDAWTEKKQKNSSFSLRAWARKLGFENNSPLSLMLAGKRPIPKKYLPHFAENLSLNARESLYLETLIDLSRSKTPREREFYLERLKSLSPRPALNVQEIDSIKFGRDPLHAMILEMTYLPDFQPDPKQIQSRLLVKATIPEIEAAIDRLLTLGLLIRTDDGQLKKTHVHLHIHPKGADQMVQDFHRNCTKVALDINLSVPPAGRELSTFILNMGNASLPRAKEKIQEFVQNFIREFESQPGYSEETFQFMVQLFPLTSSKKKERA